MFAGPRSQIHLISRPGPGTSVLGRITLRTEPAGPPKSHPACEGATFGRRTRPASPTCVGIKSLAGRPPLFEISTGKWEAAFSLSAKPSTGRRRRRTEATHHGRRTGFLISRVKKTTALRDPDGGILLLLLLLLVLERREQGVVMEGLRGDQQWWHSPPPPRNDDPGDRFIPTRSLMNMDFARSSLTPRSGTAPVPEKFSSPAKQAYRRIVEQNLTLDSEGKPLKMLVFKGSPRKSGGRLLLVDEMLHDDLGRDRNRPPPIRTLPNSADKVLDAPNLADDYYLNLMDWGQKNILAIALGQSLYLWNAANGETQELLNVGREVFRPTSVRWSADGEKLAVGFMDATVEIWDAASARQVRMLEGHTDRVSSLSWNHNLLSSGSRDTSIINHDARTSSSSASRFQAHTSDVCGLRWSGSGKLLASGGNDNLVCVWEASNRRPSRPLHRLEGHSAAVRALAWCPFQSSVLASGGGTADRCIRLWNTQTGNCAGSTDGGSQVCALEWNRHRKEILSAHGFVHNQLCLWSYPSMSKIGELNGHTGRVLHLAQSPDGATVASAGADETLRFWKVFGPPPARAREGLRSSLLSMTGAHIR